MLGGERMIDVNSISEKVRKYRSFEREYCTTLFETAIWWANNDEEKENWTELEDILKKLEGIKERKSEINGKVVEIGIDADCKVFEPTSKEPYAFICYANEDADRVTQEAKRFNEDGYYIWCEGGSDSYSINIGKRAEALAQCAVFIIMITPASVLNEKVQNEIYYAISEKKPILAIHLEKTDLPGGLKLQIGTKQAILKYCMNEDEYIYKCYKAFSQMGMSRYEPNVLLSMAQLEFFIDEAILKKKYANRIHISYNEKLSLIVQLDDAISLSIFGSLSEEQADKLDKLLDKEKEDPKVFENFFLKEKIDFDGIITNTYVDFLDRTLLYDDFERDLMEQFDLYVEKGMRIIRQMLDIDNTGANEESIGSLVMLQHISECLRDLKNRIDKIHLDSEDHTLEESKLVPGIGRKPYPAYRGNEPYVFVSYAHADADKVFSEIRRFNNAGFHLWYDEGISPGNEWPEEIASAIDNCSGFVVMISPKSIISENVRNEVGFAISENKPFLAIFLEETDLGQGLRLQIGSRNVIYKYRLHEEVYEAECIDILDRMGLKRLQLFFPFDSYREWLQSRADFTMHVLPVVDKRFPTFWYDADRIVRGLDKKVASVLLGLLSDSQKKEFFQMRFCKEKPPEYYFGYFENVGISVEQTCEEVFHAYIKRIIQSYPS